jgi:alkylhydroperoxidase/carboxymuconolactone decarboxylase family protein YurZ
VEQTAAIGDLAFDLGLEGSDPVLDLLPEGYRDAYSAVGSAATRRNALTTAERELLLMALNASITVFDPAAVERHARRALEAGATPAQVVATKVETMGAHTLSTFVPLLVEELSLAGQGIAIPATDEELTHEEAEAKAEIIRLRGWWNEAWRPMLRLDPQHLLASQRFMAQNQQLLEPRLRELIYVAVDIVTTHLYVPGARAHIRNALKLGITAEELLEVFELAALVPFKSTGLVLASLSRASGEIR